LSRGGDWFYFHVFRRLRDFYPDEKLLLQNLFMQSFINLVEPHVCISVRFLCILPSEPDL